MGNANFVAEVDWSGGFSGEIGAVASIASTGVSPVISFGDVAQIKLDIVYYTGYAGLGVEWDTNTQEYAVNFPSVGHGFKVGVDFDWK